MLTAEAPFNALFIAGLAGQSIADAALAGGGFRVIRAGDADEAESRLSCECFDLLLADIDEAGLRPACALAQRPGGPPLLALARRVDPLDRIIALENGADELMSAESDPREIASKARALARRSRLLAPAGARPGGSGWRLQAVTRQLTGPNGERVSLTPNEVALLDVLMTPPKTLTGIARIGEALGQEGPCVIRVRTAMARLRKQLDEAGCPRNLITTVRGAGYVFNGEAA